MQLFSVFSALNQKFHFEMQRLLINSGLQLNLNESIEIEVHNSRYIAEKCGSKREKQKQKKAKHRWKQLNTSAWWGNGHDEKGMAVKSLK